MISLLAALSTEPEAYWDEPLSKHQISEYTTAKYGCPNEHQVCDFISGQNSRIYALTYLWPLDRTATDYWPSRAPYGGEAYCNDPLNADTVSCFVSVTDPVLFDELWDEKWNLSPSDWDYHNRDYKRALKTFFHIQEKLDVVKQYKLKCSAVRSCELELLDPKICCTVVLEEGTEHGLWKVFDWEL